MSEHSDDACEVPLVERLRSVPSDARAEVEVGYCHHRYIPYGRLCHDAATKIRYFEAELAAANAEVARMKGKVEYLQNWIRRLEVIEANPTEHRRWCGEIGWLNPGQCVFVGSEKPDGLL